MWLDGRWRPSPRDGGSRLPDLTAQEGAVDLNLICPQLGTREEGPPCLAGPEAHAGRSSESGMPLANIYLFIQRFN